MNNFSAYNWKEDGLTVGKCKELLSPNAASMPPKMPQYKAVSMQRVLLPNEPLYALPVRKVDQLSISANYEQAPRAFKIRMIANLSKTTLYVMILICAPSLEPADSCWSHVKYKLKLCSRDLD